MLIRFLVSQLESHASVVVVGVGGGVGYSSRVRGYSIECADIDIECHIYIYSIA